MTNDRIQKWLASVAAQKAATAAEQEAFAILTFLCGPEGAVQLADDAAWEIIASECRASTLDGHIWWEIDDTQPSLELDAENVYIAASVSAALRYLAARGLAIHHPMHRSLVRSE